MVPLASIETDMDMVQSTIQLVMLVCGLDYAGVAMMRTILPYFAARVANAKGSTWGAGTIIGGLESSYGIGQLIGASFMGRLSDLRGRRPVMLLSFLGSAIGYTIAGFAWSPLILVLSRLPVGLSKQTITVSRAIIADVADGQTRSASMARIVGASNMGYAVGPLLGPYIAAEFGENTPALVGAAVFAVLIPLAFVKLHETNPVVRARSCVPEANTTSNSSNRQKSPSKNSGQLWLPLLSNKKLVVTIAVLTLPEFALVMHTTTGLSSYAVSEIVHSSKTALGISNSMHAVESVVVATILLPFLVTTLKWTDEACMYLGLSGFVAGMTLLIIAPPSETIMYLSVLPMALGTSILRSVPPSLVSKRCGPDIQGGAMGFIDVTSSCCRVVAPLACGLIVDNFGIRAPFVLELLLTAIGILLFIFVVDERQAKKSKAQ